MRRVVYDQKERFGEFAREVIGGVEWWGPDYQAIGLEEDGQPIAAVVYNHWSDVDCAMHVAAVPGRRWMTREFLRAVFRYPFIQEGCHRVTGYVPASNADALRFDIHLGFKPEGKMRDATHDGEDVWVLGMLKRECRWLQ